MEVHVFGKVRKNPRLLPPKMLLVMKLIAFFLLALTMHVCADGLSQNVTISEREISLDKVFTMIHEQTGFEFIYDQQAIEKAPLVTLHVKNMSLTEVLNKCFKGLPYKFLVLDKTIVISAKQPKPATPAGDSTLIGSPAADIRGRVTDSLGNPLAGATVAVKGTPKVELTNGNGEFTVKEINGKITLQVSFVGYDNAEIITDGLTPVHIVLRLKSSSGLNDVVVVGYGTQKKINLTGAVDQIGGQELQNRPIANVSQALQGMMASLNITTNSSGGQPDATKTINIRGYTGYDQLASPLILVDGVPADINAINVNDIETVTMLKDAAASAIYGSRAPNGVLLITTKQGKKGQPMRFSYSNNFSFNNPIGLPQTMNSYDFANLYNEASQNAGQGTIFPQSQLDGILKYMKDPTSVPATTPSADGSYWNDNTGVANNDWYDIFMKKNVFSQQHNIGLDGGSDKITYFMGLGYNQQNGNMNFFDGQAYKRYNFRANVNATVTSWMSIGLQTSYSQQNDKVPYAGDIGYNWFYDIPRYWTTSPLKDPNGGWDPNTMAAAMSSGNVWQKDQKNDTWIKGSVNINPVRGWEIHGDYAYNYFAEPSSSLIGYYPVSTPNDPAYISSDYNTYTATTTNNHYYNYNIYTSYERRLGGHYFKAMVGQQEEYQYNYSMTGSNTYLYNQNQPSLSLSYGSTTSATDAASAWSSYGTFGRFNYNYKEKYLLELNGRYMGSSLFPSNTRYHFFNAMSAGWNISKEEFFSPLTKWVNNLKVRGSYGGLGDLSYFLNKSNYYPATANLGTNPPTSTSWVFSSTGVREPSVTPAGLVSPNITWSKPSMLDIGADISFLKNFNVTFDWYRRRITDLFGPGSTYPTLLGTSAPTENNAITQTTGFELTAYWKHQFGKVGFTVRALLSNYKGKIISYSGNPTRDLTNGNWYNGEPIGAIWGYQTVGKFQSDAEVARAPSQSFIAANWYAGDIQYADLNHDGKINYGNYTADNHGDLRIIGNSTPQYNYGLNLGANWNGFDAYTFFQGVGGGHYFPRTNAYWGVIGTDLYHAPALKTLYDRWTPTNPDGYFPKAQFGTSQDRQTQTGYLVSLAYLRMKNLQLGYTLPPGLTRRWKLSKVRFYGSIDNVFTIAPELKHSYIDPEELEAGEQIYPLMRSISFGAQINID